MIVKEINSQELWVCVCFCVCDQNKEVKAHTDIKTDTFELNHIKSNVGPRAMTISNPVLHSSLILTRHPKNRILLMQLQYSLQVSADTQKTFK